ncbi:MAG: hypothetical protein K6G88_12955 [Lachnospiraceae bacterium]|nr:hypothetical protein [Lachnospiraceae bacterium]
MNRIKELDVYQKVIMLSMAVMIVVFAVIYLKVGLKVGFLYNDEILVKTIENGNTLYSGEINGKQTQFVVSEDNTVVLKYGDKTYGPYSVIKDEEKTNITEIREGEAVRFRGVILYDNNDNYLFRNEDGSWYDDSLGIITHVDANGDERYADGKLVDTIKPNVYTIYSLVSKPELTHKGEGGLWFVGLFLCIVNAISILFVDEIYRFELAFRVRNADDAEPSFLEMMGRYISWTVMAVGAAAIFVYGIIFL